MKKTVVSVLLLWLLFPLGPLAPDASAKNLRIALVLWRGETEAEKGLRDGLKDLGYSVQYTVMNAGQDRAELGRLLREDLKPKLDSVDYVYVYGTTVTLAAKSIVQDKTPMIFNIVADPVGAGVVQAVRSAARAPPQSARRHRDRSELRRVHPGPTSPARGRPRARPEQRPSTREIVASEEGERLLAGYLLRRSADRLSSRAVGERAETQLHYDH